MQHDFRDGGVLHEPAHVNGLDRALPHRWWRRCLGSSQRVGLRLPSSPAGREDQHRDGRDAHTHAQGDGSHTRVVHSSQRAAVAGEFRD